MEGVEGGQGGRVVDSVIVFDGSRGRGHTMGYVCLEDLGGHSQRQYGTKWGGSQKGGGGSRKNPNAGARGVVAITQPGFCRGVEVSLHHGELCFKTFGSNPK